jgi:hypothetical protein
VSIHKWPICPLSALREKFNPRDINHMPAVKFSARLDLEQIILFLDGHKLGEKFGFDIILIQNYRVTILADGHQAVEMRFESARCFSGFSPGLTSRPFLDMSTVLERVKPLPFSDGRYVDA